MEISWRLAYEIITQEIRNMDEHIPELKGILNIWFEFLPAYQEAIAGTARLFVTSTYDYLVREVSTDAASTIHIAKMLHTQQRRTLKGLGSLGGKRSSILTVELTASSFSFLFFFLFFFYS